MLWNHTNFFADFQPELCTSFSVFLGSLLNIEFSYCMKVYQTLNEFYNLQIPLFLCSPLNGFKLLRFYFILFFLIIKILKGPETLRHLYILRGRAMVLMNIYLIKHIPFIAYLRKYSSYLFQLGKSAVF